MAGGVDDSLEEDSRSRLTRSDVEARAYCGGFGGLVVETLSLGEVLRVEMCGARQEELGGEILVHRVPCLRNRVVCQIIMLREALRSSGSCRAGGRCLVLR